MTTRRARRAVRIIAGLLSVLTLSLYFATTAQTAHAATNVYYSVGSSASTNYLTGTSVTVTIDGSGNATFSAPQTSSSTGVGDIVLYGGSSGRVFISGKTSSTVWTVVTATGGLPAATTSAPVSSITHAFSSLQAALNYGTANNATSTNFLNTSDLVTGNFILNIPLYNDTGTADTHNVNIGGTGWNVGASNYINIYTPTSTAQVNASQRHNGTFSTSVGYAILANVSGQVLNISMPYVRIDGIQVKNTAANWRTISFGSYPSAVDDRYISNSILGMSGDTGTIINDSESGANVHFHYWNNLFVGASTAIAAANSSYGTSTVYNNTFYDNKIGIVPYGNCSFGYKVEFVNNLFASTTNPFTTGTCSGTYSGYNATASTSLGYSGGSNALGHDLPNETFSFFDAPNGNYALASGDVGAKDLGTTSPSYDTFYPFTSDIIGTARPYGTAWDIGAFEYSPGPDTQPPGLSAGSPSGQIAYDGTGSTTLSVTTNENADCRYATSTGVAYSSMTGTFTTDGGLTHSTSLTGLKRGQVNNYYIRCFDTDGSNNVDTSDYTVSFEINQGTAGTVYAASCSVADTNAAMAYVNAGDTLSIPAGTCGGYTSSTGLAITKAITVTGAGEGQTILQIASTTPGTYFNGGIMPIGAAATVENLTVETDTSNTAGTGSAFVISPGVTGFRITNVQYIEQTSNTSGYFVGVNTGAYGLIDHNSITGGAGTDELIFVYGPTDSWQQPESMGSSTAVFIEDNTIAGHGYVTDCNANARCVVRRNTITGPIKLDAHGKASNTPARGVRQYEAYNNLWTDTSDSAWPAIEMRGGTGMIFNNVSNQTAGANAAWLFMTDYAYQSTWPNFSSVYQTPNNYPVDDQIGVGEDSKTAASEPFYLWGNTLGGQWWPLSWKSVSDSTLTTNAAGYTTGVTTINLSTTYNNSLGTVGAGNYVVFAGDTHRYQLASTLSNGGTSITIAAPGLQQSIPASQTSITLGPNTNYQGQQGNTTASFLMSDVVKPNRDFYISSTTVSFDGTANGTSAGVGSGTFASKPSTCTKGVSYWATDKGGNWDASNATSNDGALYKCTATNTWTLYYTPYAYPHFLTAASTTDTDVVDIGGGARFFGTGKFYAVSTSTMTGAYATLGATTTPIAATTASSSADYWLDATISTWLKSGTYEKTWTETSNTLNATTTHHMVGDLQANTTYNVKVDGSLATATVNGASCSAGVCTSDASGKIYFDYTGGYSTHTFDVVPSGTISAPTVTTQAASSISSSGATGNGNITATNGANPTVRGFVYGTTLSYGATTTESGSFSTGVFTGSISSLACSTSYDVAAYATNSGGTTYGSNQSFTTSACSAPTVVASAASSIAQTGAVLNGSISATGGQDATQSGFAWGTTADLSGGDTATTTEGSQTGAASFSHTLSGLTCASAYYFRAYATNPTGTSLSSISSLTTSSCSSTAIAAPATVSALGSGPSSFTAPIFAPGVIYSSPLAAAPSAAHASISTPLTLGQTSVGVVSLQKILNAHGFVVALSGPGSPGHETESFGPLTKKAVEAFQIKYEIAKAGDPGYGTVGPKTRAILNELAAGNTVAPVQTSSNAAPIAAVSISSGLGQGSVSSSVQSLQSFLNSQGFTISSSGAGSPGHETSFFGPATVKAVQAFQKAYGIAGPGDPGYGYVGPATRAKIESLTR